jgi:prepilin peptidase CpaA
MSSLTSVLVASGLTAGVIWSAWCDLGRRRIPNAAVLAIAALYPVACLVGVLSGPWWAGVAAGGGVFVLGLCAFARSAVGGGDVKLAAALGLWAGCTDIAGFLLVTALAGAGLSILILASRNLPFSHYLSGPIVAGPQTRGREIPKESVPYGVALAAGGLWIAYGLSAA